MTAIVQICQIAAHSAFALLCGDYGRWCCFDDLSGSIQSYGKEHDSWPLKVMLQV